MIKEKGLFRSSGIKSPVALKDLRGKIILTALIFLIIILIYQTYFESTTSNNDSENDKLIKLSNSPSQNLFENKDNTSERIFHPTIASNERNYYLVAFEMVGINGTSSIWLSSSVNGKTWTTPKIFDNNQSNKYR